MNYAQQQRNPAKHAVGLTVVILFHIILVWAFMNGLVNKVKVLVQPPADVKIIEDIKPPPPPEVKLPPPPKFAAPPPPYIPPPEVQIQTPPVQNVITAETTNTPPAVVAAVAPRAEPAAAAGPSTAVGVACPNSSAVQKDTPYPREALRDNVQGEVIVRFTVSATGELKNAGVAKSSGNRFLDRAALAASQKFQCRGQGQDIVVEAPFSFKME